MKNRFVTRQVAIFAAGFSFGIGFVVMHYEVDIHWLLSAVIGAVLLLACKSVASRYYDEMRDGIEQSVWRKLKEKNVNPLR